MIHSWVNVDVLPPQCKTVATARGRTYCSGQCTPRLLRWIVVFYLLSLQFVCAIADSQFHNHPSASLLQEVVEPKGSFWTSPTRIGEASHPGPIKVAIINPTSIVSKSSQFQHLIHQQKVDIICASETAATIKGQKLFASTLKASCGFKSLWSNPVADQFCRNDGDGSLRGRAAGVGVFSKLPMRHAIDTLPDAIQATSRVIHSVHCVGVMQFQVLTVYGLASHTPEAIQITDDLLTSALEASKLLRLPTIICGDFNSLPLQLECGILLKHQGFQDLLQLHRRIYGQPMPPTCRDTTNPDNALLCPIMARWLCHIRIEEEQLFDCHKVVFMHLDIPHEEQFVSRIPMPTSWISLPIDPDKLVLAYNQSSFGEPSPQSLEEWGTRVETAVDVAYHDTQAQQGFVQGSVRTIPKKDKGRCKPRQLRKLPIASLTPKPRPGEYQPIHEIHTFKTQKLIKQLRRVQSFRRRLIKLPQGSVLGLWEEWTSILFSKVPEGSFIRWCQYIPELGPPPRELPTLDFVHLLEQFIRLRVDAEVASDHRLWLKKLEYHRHLDAKELGSSQAFARLKDSWKQPFTEIAQTISEPAIVVEDTPTTLRVFCDRPEQFDATTVVVVDQATCHIQTIESDCLIVQHNLVTHTWPEEVVLSQNLVHYTPKAIVQALVDYWDPFWNNPRAAEDLQPEFQQFLDTLPASVCPDIRTDDPQLWIQAVRSLKPSSARGVDAISAAELQMLPPEAISDLGRVLGSYHAGFPSWLMVARTFAVPKTDQTPTAAEIRPITVLAQTYRLWARVICKQLLAHFSKVMPAEIWGLLSGRGPFDASYQLQLWLETHSFQQIPTAGLVLDLVKCFNSIHRPSAYAVLRHLQIPADILAQWSGSLSHLTRIWSIDGWESNAMPCIHGFPEGDIFSVIVMIALAHAWSAHLKCSCQEALVGSYADNWCFASTVAVHFAPLIRATVHFVQATMMAIDWQKTWIWATSKGLHDSLKATLKRILPAIDVARLHTATDLGCQMTYSGPPRLGRMKKRFLKAKQRCQILAKLPHDIYTKCHLARASITPAATYGIETIPVGEQHLIALRQHLVTSVMGYNHSRSSAIAMQLLPGLTDPCLLVILLSIQAARRYLAKATVADQQLFFRMLACHTGLAVQCRGPVGVLKHYLLRLGWSVDRLGFVHVTGFIKLHLLETSLGSWHKWGNFVFQQQLFLYYVDRKALRGSPAMDIPVTRGILHKFESRHLIRLVNEISGGFQTAEQKSKWDPATDLLCNYCNGPDSRVHRMFECPATSCVREAFAETITFFQEFDDQIHELPVLVCDPKFELLQILHWNQPCAEFDPSLVQQIKELSNTGHTPVFYTDGSCQFPQMITARFAAFAIIIDLATSDSDRRDAALLYQSQGVSPVSLATLLISRCPGDQRIGRAELFAIICILETFPEAVVYSDSACSIAKFCRCRLGDSLSQFVNSEDFDLVQRLHGALRPSHQVIKVAAHSDIRKTLDPLQAYHQLGNEKANDMAIQACWQLHQPFVKECDEYAKQLDFRSKHLRSLYDMLLQLQEHRAILHSRAVATKEVTELVTTRCRQSFEQQLIDWVSQSPWSPPAIRVSRIQCASWGPLYGAAMQEWMSLCVWPSDLTADNVGITWLELSLAFSWWTGFFFAVPRSVGKSQEALVILDTMAAVESFQVKFSDIARSFAIYHDQIRQLVIPHQWPCVERGLVRSLYNLGSATFSSGFKVRPQYPGQDIIVPILRAHYKQQKTTTHSAIPNIPLTPRWTVRQLQEDVRGSWSTRGAKFSKVAKELRRFARDVSQCQLVF